MKHLKTYDEFTGIEEEAVKGEDSKVVVDDTYISKLDKDIKGAEILGVIKSSESEDEFKDYFYNEYGESSFTTAEMSQLVTYFNEYEAEKNAEEAEKEKEEESGDEVDVDVDTDIDTDIDDEI